MAINNIIQGRSGCNIQIDSSNPNLIRKYSKDINYNIRLKSQIEKQIYFYKYSNYKYILAPKVTLQGYNEDGLYFFEMDYINGAKFSNYLIDLRINDLFEIANKLLNYLDINKKNSILRSDSEIFISKLESIKKNLFENKSLCSEVVSNSIMLLEKFDFNLEIPISNCHGDLTFSNMIFKSDNIYVFDFLDSFIESYLIDIVKIRQDTSFYWSILMDSNIDNYNHVKLKQIMSYLDNLINNYFLQDSYYLLWYKCLQNFNLLRILPYVNDENEIKFIENALYKLNKNYE